MSALTDAHRRLSLSKPPKLPEVVIKFLCPFKEDAGEYIIPETVIVMKSQILLIPGIKPMAFMCYPDKIVELKK